MDKENKAPGASGGSDGVAAEPQRFGGQGGERAETENLKAE